MIITAIEHFDIPWTFSFLPHSVGYPDPRHPDQVVILLLEVRSVERNEDQPNEKTKSYLFRACYSQGTSAIITGIWQTIKSRQRSGKALQWNRRMVQVFLK